MQIGDDDEVNNVDLGDENAGGGGEGAEGQDSDSGGKKTAGAAEHAGDGEDDGEREAEGRPDQVEADDEPKPLTRAQARFQRLANETRAAREEAAAARREAEDLKRQSWQRNEQITAQEEAQRLALMTPEERADYKIEKNSRETREMLQRQRFETQAMMDKAAFDAKASMSPVYAKHADVVEAKFQELMRAGRPVDRETILRHHLGDLALRGASNGGQQRKQARARVESQRVASGSGKGDAASNRGKAGDTPESRLKDVFI